MRPTFPPAGISTNGSQQGSASGAVQNAAVVGEPMVVRTAADASATVQVRHGYTPSGQ